jgi:hypothetical protein
MIEFTIYAVDEWMTERDKECMKDQVYAILMGWDTANC